MDSQTPQSSAEGPPSAATFRVDPRGPVDPLAQRARQPLRPAGSAPLDRAFTGPPERSAHGEDGRR
ncbi:hypothetical protein GCM10023336_61900 [Streptomyces similanensis]|uniref:Uncharacterized protein n=1 Tax=Streptomyces similanensis TaxID=1274988 RepID=A0ABP9LDK6_9ACTN